MKRQKKYLTREMIVKDIDAAQRKLKRIREQAMCAGGEASMLFSFGNDEGARQARAAEDKLWDKAHRLETTRMKRLKDTLASFDTKTFPVEGLNSEQVVLEKV